MDGKKIPIIAIPTRIIEDKEYGIPAQGCSAAYVDSIRHVGGSPFLMPTGTKEDEVEVLLSVADGLLLTGGEDICPAFYQAEPHQKLEKTSFERDSLEFTVFRAALRRKLPILGICRGLQLINVATGGTLYQDIPSDVPSALNHSSQGADAWIRNAHDVAVAPDSLLRTIVDKDILNVNSLHHQGIKDLGKGLSVVAVSNSDKIVEAIELQGLSFGLAVQWHPEVMWQTELNGQVGAADNSSLLLFKVFVEAAATYAAAHSQN